MLVRPLEVENLEVAYSRVIVAVQGVSLKVPDNSIVALLGTNGAGKSTTVRAISGFLPVDDADDQEGHYPFRWPVDPWAAALRYGAAWRRTGAGAAQDFRDADGRGEHADLAARATALARYRPTSSSLFEIFPVLAQRRKQIPGYLSGGERQMLAIAQALLCEPKLLIVDELSLGLAPLLVKELMAQLVDCGQSSTCRSC